MNPLTEASKLVPRVRRAYRELDELARREAWTREQIEAHQLGRVNELWAAARRDVPYYRTLAGGLPGRFESLDHYRSTMPLLAKDVLRIDGRSLLADHRARGGWHLTSGSTGTPTALYWSHEAHRAVLRARYRFYRSWGVDVLDRTAFVWGGGERGGWAGRTDRVAQVAQDRLRQRLRLSAASPSLDDLRRIRDHRPVMLYGYTQAVHALAERLGVTATPPIDSLRVVMVTGEAADDGVLDTIEAAFGVPAAVEYGSTESPLIAGSQPGGGPGLVVREDIALVETIARGDGGYDVVLTPLVNPSFPLFRYMIEDVCPEPLRVPDVGFATLDSVTGRSDDMVLSSSGRRLHSSAFDEIFEERPDQVRRFRVHQLGDGSVDVLVEPTGVSPLDEDIVRRDLQRVMGDYPVRMSVVEAIGTSESGKRRVVRSDMATTS